MNEGSELSEALLQEPDEPVSSVRQGQRLEEEDPTTASNQYNLEEDNQPEHFTEQSRPIDSQFLFAGKDLEENPFAEG